MRLEKSSASRSGGSKIALRPDAVAEDLAALLSILREQPGIGSRVLQASSPDTRRFHLDRIGHWVYYRTRGDRLEILAVWYSGRKKMPVV